MYKWTHDLVAIDSPKFLIHHRNDHALSSRPTIKSFYIITNARALIGQSAVGYCAGKPTEKSRVF